MVYDLYVHFSFTTSLQHHFLQMYDGFLKTITGRQLFQFYHENALQCNFMANIISLFNFT